MLHHRDPARRESTRHVLDATPRRLADEVQDAPPIAVRQGMKYDVEIVGAHDFR
jgi:hypothetical protein